MTDAMPDFDFSEAACIASPRALVMRTPSSKEMAPAKASAVYSPSDRPIAMLASSMIFAPPSDARSISTAASEATKIAGCETTVVSSLALSSMASRS